MRRAYTLVLLFAALAVVASLPHSGMQGHRILGESDTPEEVIADATLHVHKEAAAADATHAHLHRVVDAVHHVWRTSDFKDLYKEDKATGHWHCKRCHSQCKTVKCNKWCHDKFCGKDYEKMLQAKTGMGRFYIDRSQLVTPQYIQSVKDANKALQNVETAKNNAAFRKASRTMKTVSDEQQQDFNNFDGSLKMADAVDKSAYPSEREQEANEENMELMESAEQKQSLALKAADTKASEDEAAKNEGLAEATKTVEEADKAMGAGGSMMAEIEEVSSAEDATLQNKANKQEEQELGHPQMAQVEDVAAEAEKMGTKLDAANSRYEDAEASLGAGYDRA